MAGFGSKAGVGARYSDAAQWVWPTPAKGTPLDVVSAAAASVSHIGGLLVDSILRNSQPANAESVIACAFNLYVCNGAYAEAKRRRRVCPPLQYCFLAAPKQRDNGRPKNFPTTRST